MHTERNARGPCSRPLLQLLLPLGILMGSFAIVPAAEAQDVEVSQQPVFTIERSKNSKVVQYDIRLGADQKPIRDEPLAGYWRREDGSTAPLSRLQWTAYGFDATCSENCAVVTIEMRADIGRRIRIRRVDDVYRAETEISGQPAIIERIYIKSTERRFLWPRVDHIDFRGQDLVTGETLSERFVP